MTIVQQHQANSAAGPMVTPVDTSMCVMHQSPQDGLQYMSAAGAEMVPPPPPVMQPVMTTHVPFYPFLVVGHMENLTGPINYSAGPSCNPNGSDLPLNGKTNVWSGVDYA